MIVCGYVKLGGCCVSGYTTGINTTGRMAGWSRLVGGRDNIIDERKIGVDM